MRAVSRRPKGFHDPLTCEWINPPGPGRPKGSRRADLTGQTFRHLTVLERVEDASGSKAQYRCQCDCGEETVARGDNLTSGRKVSCGHVGHGDPYSVIGKRQERPPVESWTRERAAQVQADYVAAERRKNGL